YADVQADSLWFDGLRGSFPTLPLHGAVFGPVKLAGPLSALETHVDLHSSGGEVRGDGTLLLDLPHYGARGLNVVARDVDLARWLGGGARVPPSRLTFTLRGDVAGDSAVPPVGTVHALLEPSQLAGPARVALRLDGSLDSLGLEARASVERLAWRDWRLPAGRARLAWGPTVALEATLDSVAHGAVGFSGVVASARGNPDSLTWQVRSRIGDAGAFLAGGRFARRTEPGSRSLAIGLDSLGVQVPGDVWILDQPTELTVTDSAATVSRFALHSVYGSGKLLLEGALPTRGRADAHLQVEAFPFAGLYALLQQDTA